MNKEIKNCVKTKIFKTNFYIKENIFYCVELYKVDCLNNFRVVYVIDISNYLGKYRKTFESLVDAVTIYSSLTINRHKKIDELLGFLKVIRN